MSGRAAPAGLPQLPRGDVREVEKKLLEVGAHLTIGAYHKPSYGADIDEPLLRWADFARRGADEECKAAFDLS